jgi:transmembrane sensor
MKETFSMDKYKDFSVEDFLQDEFFRRWVEDPFCKDAELWERWLDVNTNMQGVVDEAKGILLSFEYQPKQLPAEFYSKLKSRIDTTNSNFEGKENSGFFKAHWQKFAAVIAGLLVITGILMKPKQEEGLLTYSNKYGQTKRLVLPDGSEIVLNANSSIKYKNNTINTPREVWLKGEGFFYIKPVEDDKKSRVKFIVHAGDVNIEVVGTRFNVNSNERSNTTVLLTNGKVRLSVAERREQVVNMVPGELVEYSTNTKKLSIQKVRPHNYTAWIEHKYIFEKSTLGEVTKVLQHYYGKRFTIQDSAMQNKMLSGTLELQDEDVLIKTLSVLMGVTVYKNGNDVIIGSQ